jgi:hypothetical protein
MKFLCIACDEAMRLRSTEGPDRGSLTVTFACPVCGHQVAMLTNPWETQMVRTLGVKVTPAGQPVEAPSPPFAGVRAALAHQREDAFRESEPASAEPAGSGPGCPFAAMIPGYGAPAPESVTWTPEADERAERIPAFIRPMARQAIERFARDRGYGTVTAEVMDQARDFIGM